MSTEVMTEPRRQNRKPTEFENEPLTDFSKPENKFAMETALKKVRAEFGRELTGFTQDTEGVTARIAGADGEETVRTRYLVGADGGRSFVRRTLDVGCAGAARASSLSRRLRHPLMFQTAGGKLGSIPVMSTDTSHSRWASTGSCASALRWTSPEAPLFPWKPVGP